MHLLLPGWWPGEEQFIGRPRQADFPTAARDTRCVGLECTWYRSDAQTVTPSSVKYPISGQRWSQSSKSPFYSTLAQLLSYNKFTDGSRYCSVCTNEQEFQCRTRDQHRASSVTLKGRGGRRLPARVIEQTTTIVMKALKRLAGETGRQQTASSRTS